ncbi:hypothetical protein C8N40_10929 [Pontibacter mucosus]|uniref:Uncharacterized protein n=1 Tax=Pontibacter mucosus TaxID=1649266 RepID=A0A2T5YDY8_9BACT|nr:hypothetical protein C8N40_10929 [Pontibacter mucosus]
MRMRGVCLLKQNFNPDEGQIGILTYGRIVYIAYFHYL